MKETKIYAVSLFRGSVKQDESAQGPFTGGNHGEDNIQEDADTNEHGWFCGSLVLGYIVGLWGVCLWLYLNRSCKDACSKYMDN